MIDLIPMAVKGVMSLFTSNQEAIKVVTDIAIESPIATAMAAISLPGLVLEFVLRKIPTKKRKGIIALIIKISAIIRKVLEVVEDALKYIDKKSDVIVKQKVKDA